VIAYKTGGLRDTVFEFDPKTKKGNGFNFQEHSAGELFFAMERAMAVYDIQDNYKILRTKAFEAAIDVADVSRAWDKEFHRLLGKVSLGD
jgi:starch synthase